jgi:hypothetical protein
MSLFLIRCFILAALAGQFYIPFSWAQNASPAVNPPSPISSQKLEDWMLDFGRNSIPLLSQKGKEATQFKLVVEAIEKYLGKSLDAEKAGARFIQSWQSIQNHFNSQNPEAGASDAEEILKSLFEISGSIQASRLIWVRRSAKAEISLRKPLVNAAEESIRKALKLLDKPDKKAAPILWWIWVESCLRTLDSSYKQK